MSIDLAIKLVVPILSTILTYLIVPLIKEKTTQERRNTILGLVKTAVMAAEIIYDEQNKGVDKKAFVLNFLIGKGINISMGELEVLIEAAVQELNLLQDQLKE